MGIFVLITVAVPCWPDARDDALGDARDDARDDALGAARQSLARGDHDGAQRLAAPYLDSIRPVWARQARLITAEALIESGRFSDAIAFLAPLIGEAPPGPADSDWVFLLARALQGQGLLLEATDWWLTHASFGRQQHEDSRRHLEHLLLGELTQAERAYLLWKHPGHELLCDAAERYAAREARAGHPQEARRVWNAGQAACGHGEHRSAAPRWWPTLAEDAERWDFFTIGLLAPLTGPYARYGISLSNGAEVARRLHNDQARFPLRIEIADSEGTPEGSLAAVARLYAEGVRVFVGELFSLNTLMAAAYLRERHAVLISPAATDSTIRRLGAGIYGCTVGPQEQVGAVLTYAADSLWVRRVALLYPYTPDGLRWAQWGRAEAQRLGLRLVYDRSYVAGTTDFSDLLARAAPTIPDSLDALYCPGETRELVALLTQMAHAGFIGTYLGNAALGAELVSRVISDFELRIVYPGDAYVPVEHPERGAGFRETYRRLFQEEADAFAHRGYAAFGLVGKAVERGGYCPAAFVQIMERASEPARLRGDGRRLQMAPAVALPELHLRIGDRDRPAGPALGPPAPAEAKRLPNREEPLWIVGPDDLDGLPGPAAGDASAIGPDTLGARFDSLHSDPGLPRSIPDETETERPPIPDETETERPR